MSEPSTIFISHSTSKLPALDPAVQVKDSLIHALEAKGWKVFLDSHSNRAGDLWRTQILHSLATAKAGIILLNDEATRSDWVKAEALIMCFRKSIDPAFPLLPIVLPGADVNATFLKTYEPFQFNEIQRSTFTLTAGESIDAFAKGVADNANLERGRQSPPTGTAWVEKVVNLLGGLKHNVLCNAAVKVKLETEPTAAATPEDLCLRLRWALANLMHHEQASTCLDVLSELMGALSAENARRLKPFVLSKCVENQSAELLYLAVTRPQQQGIFALNTSRKEVADRYVERLKTETPQGQAYLWSFSVPHPKGDLNEAGLLQMVEQEIQARLVPEPLYDDNGDELSLADAVDQLLEPANCYAVGLLPAQFAAKEVLEPLRTSFSRIVFIALAGEKWQRKQDCIDAGARILTPELTPPKRTEFSTLSTKWDALLGTNFLE